MYLSSLDHRFNLSHPRFTLAMAHDEVCFKLRETTPQSMVSFRKQCQSMQKLVRNYKLGSKDRDEEIWRFGRVTEELGHYIYKITNIQQCFL